jgi:parallel beta-helix repeat protein
MNNTNPNMSSENIEITGNDINGTKFGGVFLMGTGHRLIGNTFQNLDTAGCNESGARFGCMYKKGEPEMLEAGIYLGRGVARMIETRGNIIRNNKISGHKMKTRCIVAGPGVSLAANTVEGNQCSDDSIAH